MNVVNIAAYKFIEIPVSLHPQWRIELKEHCLALNLKGTILLAPEGINMFLAGERAQIDEFLHYLKTDQLFENRFKDLKTKESITDYQPFTRMLVRLKKEIITMRHPTITSNSLDADEKRAPSVDPTTLKKWLDQGFDDQGREILLLDTRNYYEVDIGTFENAVSFKMDFFSDFPKAIDDAEAKIKDDLQNKTVVTFCTGGIRCEKANLFLQEKKFPNLYQLDGGILNYFEKEGGAHWSGECFVFDRRVAVDPDLNETENEYEIVYTPRIVNNSI